MLLIFLIIHSFLIINADTYNIIFLKGSQIKNDFYSPFLRRLQTELESRNFPQNPTLKIGNYLSIAPPEPSSIVIGHSFGGFFALLNTIQHPENIKACILINSHFNQRGTMPYISLPLNKVVQPTLILLNQQDKKLPLSKAMDDYHVYRDNSQFPNYSIAPQKQFRIRPGTHLSSFTEPMEIEQTVSDIVDFIATLQSYDLNTTSPFDFDFNFDIEKKCLLLDNVSYWKLPNTRAYYNLPTFLASKPGLFNCIYYPGNLYKTRNLKEEQLIQELTREIHSLIIQSHTFQSIAPFPEIRFNKIYLPLGPRYSHTQSIRNGMFLYSLIKWLSHEPQVHYSMTPSPHLVVELLVVPIIDNIIYYKLPNKLRFLEL